MARAPLLQLTDVSLTFGGAPLFEAVSLAVQPGDRVALVGRNGSGKSTLLKLMAGLVEPDAGTRAVPAGTSMGYMEQEPVMDGFATLGEFAAAPLGPAELYRVEAAAEGLDFDPERPVATASGGERRRAALARLLAEAPDLMLLDEPTNHLDIAAIAWLESTLSATRAAFVVISHDRAFLRRLTRATLWVDRGELRRQDRGFEAFEAWRDKTWEEEDLRRHKLDRKIMAEGKWAVEGISARRKRNQGRLRALAEMRRGRAEEIARTGPAAMVFAEGPSTGRKVIEARAISKHFGERVILRPFDLRVSRGDRVAIVGPNGAGKSTLVGLLTGQIAPDTGEIALASGLEIALFDQARASLDPELSLWQSLTSAEGLTVSGQADQVNVRGTPRHVMSYLKDFLFSEAQVRAPVRSLSGGERARLLLARLMARQSNLLVLDEPTNDLDLETLDLLQELVADYPGTVLLVSHDRDFLDRTATLTVALEGEGRATVYAGGWSDMLSQGGGAFAAAERKAPPVPRVAPAAGKAPAKTEAAPARRKTGLSFTERHRLEALPAEIDRLTAEMARLEELLSQPDLYNREPVKFAKASEALGVRQARLAEAEEEWLALAERAEADGGA